MSLIASVEKPNVVDVTSHNRKIFDATVIFFCASVAQFIVPAPLDSFLFPAGLAYWYVQSGQDSWILDTVHEKAGGKVINVFTGAKDLAYSYMTTKKTE